MLELVGATYIHPEDSALTERSVVQFKEAGFRVNAWTVNRADRANQLFNWGVDGVISDVPDLLAGTVAAH
jgi:glycerophosphoryl diester phosphodiesterase